MTRRIALPDGQFTLVDDEDFVRFGHLPWRSVGSDDPSIGIYVVATVTGESGRPAQQVRLHRLIVDAPRGLLVDHINGDTFDNRRANLRICTAVGNGRNRRLNSNSKTGFKGVTLVPRLKKRPYVATIRTEAGPLNLGNFASSIEAALAYDRASANHHGEYGRPNFDRRRDWIFPQVATHDWPPTPAQLGGDERARTAEAHPSVRQDTADLSPSPRT